jgi:hypothetical protein
MRALRVGTVSPAGSTPRTVVRCWRGRGRVASRAGAIATMQRALRADQPMHAQQI